MVSQPEGKLPVGTLKDMGCIKAAVQGVLQGVCRDKWNVKGTIQPTVTPARVMGSGISAVISINKR